MGNWLYTPPPLTKTMLQRQRVSKDTFDDVEVEVPVKIIGCCDNPSRWVSVTYWIEPFKDGDKGRWAGLKIGQELLAWQPYPEHPKA